MKLFRLTALCRTRNCKFLRFSNGFNREDRSSYSTGLPAAQVAEPANFVKQKFNELVVWYEQVTGMDEVRSMQNRVIDAQDRFVEAQDNRREASKALVAVQSKLKDIYAELDSTSRGEERYLQLITQEHSILKEERRLQSEFAVREKEERESFTLLSNCVKESHEKERAQAERTKYWSVIGSVIGTIIGILGSSINNEFRMREIRKLVKENGLHQSTDGTASLLTKHEKELAALVSNMKSTMNENNQTSTELAITGKLDQLLHTVSGKREYDKNEFITESVQKINQNVLELKSIIHSAQRYDGQILAIPTDLESLMKSQRDETRLLLSGVALASFIIPIIVTFLLRPS